MNSRWSVAALLIGILEVPIALAQSGFPGPLNESYVPRLSQIMSMIQSQHMKLWLAGNARNWDLAAFELAQLTDSIGEAATLYSGIPSTNVAKQTAPLKSISDAIAAKDRQAFSKAVESLTKGCNACHQSMGRSFIVIQVPPTNGPFSDQLFPPRGK
jgi:hypothetical protein